MIVNELQAIKEKFIELRQKEKIRDDVRFIDTRYFQYDEFIDDIDNIIDKLSDLGKIEGVNS